MAKIENAIDLGDDIHKVHFVGWSRLDTSWTFLTAVSLCLFVLLAALLLLVERAYLIKVKASTRTTNCLTRRICHAAKFGSDGGSRHTSFRVFSSDRRETRDERRGSRGESINYKR